MSRAVVLCVVGLCVVAGCAGIPGASPGPGAEPSPSTPNEGRPVPGAVVDRSTAASTAVDLGPYAESELSLGLYRVDDGTWYTVDADGEAASRAPGAARTVAGVAVRPPGEYVWKVTVAAGDGGGGVEHGPATVVVDGTTGEVLAHHRVASDAGSS